MKKLYAALFAATVALMLALQPGGPKDAMAQTGPAGLNPGNFISNASSGADTSSSALTLGDASHFTFVCGVAVSGLGATSTGASTVTVGPVTSTTGSTVNISLGYVFPAGATVPSTPLLATFNPCIPVSGVATLTVPGAAGNTSTILSIWGFKQ